MNEKTCCFTGHRKLPSDRIESIAVRLNVEIERLIKRGVTIYYSGGALGFDQMAASIIIQKREEGQNVKLIFTLPHKKQEELWSAKQKILYKNLLAKADDIIYVSDTYDKDCMKRRNYYMIRHSDFCICALLHDKSGTFQTVKFAEKMKLEIINIADSPY